MTGEFHGCGFADPNYSVFFFLWDSDRFQKPCDLKQEQHGFGDFIRFPISSKQHAKVLLMLIITSEKDVDQVAIVFSHLRQKIEALDPEKAGAKHSSVCCFIFTPIK